ncbi:hypothetical protein YYC_02351 [Plasmodium yoelii 17X]|uniref:Uncharacterized protein n=1 Tax=Plasmodium yoelii 17X TaxID=1323249 RepID=V7PPS0_PLAYE|nr:hypothetical protein YYC_02351 [Plasmodium yoelii 17X]
MDKKVCRTLLALNNSFSKKLGEKGEYQITINKTTLNNYCTSKECSDDLAKINAGCLYLFDAFFENSSVFKSDGKGNTNIVEYIIIWLSYMLSLKNQVGDKTNLQYFYETYINNDMYTHTIDGVEEYNSYKDLIDQKKNLISMDMSIISKLYDIFITLCTMHLEYDEESRNCNKHSGKAKEFVEKYEDLKNNYNITENSPYYKLLSTLSNDYDNLKKKCSDSSYKAIPPLQSIEKTKITVDFSEPTIETSEQLYVQGSEVASNSSIANKLFIVLSIFGAIAFFWGISYKVNNKELKKNYYIYANINKQIYVS